MKQYAKKDIADYVMRTVVERTVYQTHQDYRNKGLSYSDIESIVIKQLADPSNLGVVKVNDNLDKLKELISIEYKTYNWA